MPRQFTTSPLTVLRVIQNGLLISLVVKSDIVSSLLRAEVLSLEHILCNPNSSSKMNKDYRVSDVAKVSFSSSAS